MREIPRRRLMLASVALGCALLAGAPRIAEAQPGPPGQANPGPKAQVTVLHGTPCQVKKVEADVGAEPPINYPCWKVADRKLLNLAQGFPAAMALPNGRTFQIAYNGATNERPQRFKVAALISKLDGAGFNPLADFTAEPGKDFHVGGFAHQGGTLVIRIRIVP
jgi:hypothetical protein